VTRFWGVIHACALSEGEEGIHTEGATRFKTRTYGCDGTVRCLCCLRLTPR